MCILDIKFNNNHYHQHNCIQEQANFLGRTCLGVALSAATVVLIAATVASLAATVFFTMASAFSIATIVGIPLGIALIIPILLFGNLTQGFAICAGATGLLASEAFNCR